MRIILNYPMMVEENCTGCEFCKTACKYEAIQVVDKKARIDESKCMFCKKCWDVCPNSAIMFRFLEEPKIIKIDDSDVDPVAIKELCNQAGFEPERAICVCTLTKAKEVAAAIIKGAETPEQVSVMTGIKTDCGYWCLDPVVRLLEAYGLEVKFPKTAKGGYPMTTRLSDVSEEVAKKYPEYRIEEDKKLLEKRDLPFLVEML